MYSTESYLKSWLWNKGCKTFSCWSDKYLVLLKKFTHKQFTLIRFSWSWPPSWLLPPPSPAEWCTLTTPRLRTQLPRSPTHPSTHLLWPTLPPSLTRPKWPTGPRSRTLLPSPMDHLSLTQRPLSRTQHQSHLPLWRTPPQWPKPQLHTLQWLTLPGHQSKPQWSTALPMLPTLDTTWKSRANL